MGSAPTLVKHLIALGNELSTPAWVLAVVALLMPADATRRFAPWAVAAWFAFTVVTIVHQQFDFSLLGY